MKSEYFAGLCVLKVAQFFAREGFVWTLRFNKFTAIFTDLQARRPTLELGEGRGNPENRTSSKKMGLF